MSAQEPSAPTAAPAAPTRLGRYELIGHLATGGMAEIHLARLAGEAGFEKTVVVKRLLPELAAGNHTYVRMLFDEARLVAHLDHPNICDALDIGSDGNEHYIVLPFLDGVPVKDFIARPRDPDRIAELRIAAGIIVQACAGLHHAHEYKLKGTPLDIVHRDVTPSNLFVTTSGVVKVLDFGIAKVSARANVTDAGTVKGTLLYMAPEQVLGMPVDRRVDVFALGIILFELATHQRVFKQQASDFLTAKAILEDPIPRADAVDPAIPAAVADVIERALARKAEDRYQTARDLAKALEAAMAPHGGVAASAAIADAIAERHGEELSAIRTRQQQLVEVARSTTVAGFVRGSNVATTPVGRPAPRSPSPLRFIVPAVLALLAGGAVIAFFALRPSPFATHPRVATMPDADDTTAPIVDIPGPPDPGPPIDAAQPHDVAPPDDVVTPRVDGGTAHRPDARPRVDDIAHGPAKAGYFSIESTPFATIYIDGKPFGITPLVKKELPAGRHRVKAWLDDGRMKELKIEIQPGKLAKPVVLTW
ncbi:MAG TPA: serine/threonine-protein kinase [Kofleriaceae bacterium]|nr:serine/threonine-protein kinase [Kofleriaceae bacterium]